MSVVIRIIINAAALWVAVTVLDKFNFEGSWLAFLGIAAVMGIINVTVKPMLRVLSFPVIMLTLGLFLIVINAVSLWLVLLISDALNLGLTSASFGWTVAAAMIVSVVSWALETFTGKR